MALNRPHASRHLVAKLGLNNSTHDPCLFARRVGGSVLVEGVYVSVF